MQDNTVHLEHTLYKKKKKKMLSWDEKHTVNVSAYGMHCDITWKCKHVLKGHHCWTQGYKCRHAKKKTRKWKKNLGEKHSAANRLEDLGK